MENYRKVLTVNKKNLIKKPQDTFDGKYMKHLTVNLNLVWARTDTALIPQQQTYTKHEFSM